MIIIQCLIYTYVLSNRISIKGDETLKILNGKKKLTSYIGKHKRNTNLIQSMKKFYK